MDEFTEKGELWPELLSQELVSHGTMNQQESKLMRIDVHIHSEERDDQFAQILALLFDIKKREIKMDADIQAIVDQATKNTDAESAANAALVSLFQKLTDAINNSGSLSTADRAALQAKVAEMSSSAAALSAAIVANTPAA